MPRSVGKKDSARGVALAEPLASDRLSVPRRPSWRKRKAVEVAMLSPARVDVATLEEKECDGNRSVVHQTSSDASPHQHRHAMRQEDNFLAKEEAGDGSVAAALHPVECALPPLQAALQWCSDALLGSIDKALLGVQARRKRLSMQKPSAGAGESPGQNEIPVDNHPTTQ
jgi:hypothetical protein